MSLVPNKFYNCKLLHITNWFIDLTPHPLEGNAHKSSETVRARYHSQFKAPLSVNGL